MAFMVKDGFRLCYEDTGGNGPTVLFLHGAGGNHLSWWQQVPVFAEEYRCITVDQRGFGQSAAVFGLVELAVYGKHETSPGFRHVEVVGLRIECSELRLR